MPDREHPRFLLAGANADARDNLFYAASSVCATARGVERTAVAQAVNRKPCAQLGLTDSMMPRLDGQGLGLGLFARLRPDRRTKPYRGVFAGLLSPQDPPWRLCRRPCRCHTVSRTSRRATAASCVWLASFCYHRRQPRCQPHLGRGRQPHGPQPHSRGL